MSSWSDWVWDDASSYFYRARQRSKGTWVYEYSRPLSTTIIREMGPQYITEAGTNEHPMRAPTYLLQPSTGGSPVALCADLTVFDPEPRKIVQIPEDMVFVESQLGGQWMKTSLVVEKGTPRARIDRRFQKVEGVKRVQDWRTRLDEW